MTSPSFPVSLDALANPGPTTETDDTGFELDIVVARLQNIAMAIEAKLGIGASTPAGTAAVLRRTAAGSSAWGQVVDADVAAGAAIATGKLATGAAAGFKGTQYNAAQTVAQPAAAGFTAMTGTSLAINALGGPILFGVSLLDFGCSAAASMSVQIWEGSTPLAPISNEVVPASLYKTTTTMVFVTGITAGAHSYYLVWKSNAGTITANSVSFWGLEIKAPIQGA